MYLFDEFDDDTEYCESVIWTLDDVCPSPTEEVADDLLSLYCLNWSS